jgi:substrate-binding family protein
VLRALAVFTALTALAVMPAIEHSIENAPRANEIGVSPTEIHVAVLADVDNAIAPGIFQGVVDGVQGAAAYINSKAGGGGIAGRNLVVDFIDSKLAADTARNGVIAACENDFALVGTAALFLTNVDDAVNCKDQAGAATGLPDISAIVTGVAEACSPVSFPILPSQLVCSTKDQHPQLYIGNQGGEKYLLKSHQNDLHGAMIVAHDTMAAQLTGQVLTAVASSAGIKADQSVTRSARDPQSAYTAIINQMKIDNSNYAFSVVSVNGAVALRSEAQLQGLNAPDIVWECPVGCYDKALTANASVMDGEYIAMNFLPFEDASSNAMLQSLLKYVRRDKANGFSVYGWSAGLAFAQAARAAVAKVGVNGLTRRSFLQVGIPTLRRFDAGGIIGTQNIADKVPTPCFLLVQLRHGRFVREHPMKKGTFDCKPSNRLEVKADLLGR